MRELKAGDGATDGGGDADAARVELPRELLRVLDGFLAERFPKATPRRLAADVARLSEAFTAERSELPGSYLNHPPSRSAYLAFFHPQQALRGIAALGEVRRRAALRGMWPAREPLRVLDLGAGLGAMSQALLASGPLPGAVEFTLVDHQRSALADGRELVVRAAAALRPGSPPPLVRAAAATLYEWLGRAHAAGWRYDVALLGGVLNEIAAPGRVGGALEATRNRRSSRPDAAAEAEGEDAEEDDGDDGVEADDDDDAPEDRRGPWTRTVERVLGLLDPGGVMVAVEPAIPPVARALMQSREDLLGAATTIAPCTHGEACPLLALRKDWCFTTRPARLPPFVRAMAERLRHQTDEVRWAFWAAAPGPGPGAAPPPPEHDESRHARVVSDAMLGGQVVCCQGRRDRRDERAAPLRRGTLLRR